MVSLLLCERPFLEDIITNRHHRGDGEKRAQEGGHPAVEQQQLHKIADVYAGGERCRTAIQAATDGGHLAVVVREGGFRSYCLG